MQKKSFNTTFNQCPHIALITDIWKYKTIVQYDLTRHLFVQSQQ